jgi:threonine/homoserine/homoserine lactone efflux protein
MALVTRNALSAGMRAASLTAFGVGLGSIAWALASLTWLNLYGCLVSRAGRSPAGVRVRSVLEKLTGIVLVGLGVRLAFERR